MYKKIFASAITFAALCAPLQAAVLYTFNYDAQDSYTAASITFSSADFARSGDSLQFVSGSINGCAPTSLLVDPDWSDAFTMPVFGFIQCGDGVGPAVDGLFFQVNTGLPSTLGIFQTMTAGRMVIGASGDSAFYTYTSGSLEISQDSPVPEPSSLALFGIALAGLTIGASKRAKRH